MTWKHSDCTPLLISNSLSYNCVQILIQIPKYVTCSFLKYWNKGTSQELIILLNIAKTTLLNKKNCSHYSLCFSLACCVQAMIPHSELVPPRIQDLYQRVQCFTSGAPYISDSDPLPWYSVVHLPFRFP